jgi:hypothetical protein
VPLFRVMQWVWIILITNGKYNFQEKKIFQGFQICPQPNMSGWKPKQKRKNKSLLTLNRISLFFFAVAAALLRNTLGYWVPLKWVSSHVKSMLESGPSATPASMTQWRLVNTRAEKNMQAQTKLLHSLKMVFFFCMRLLISPGPHVEVLSAEAQHNEKWSENFYARMRGRFSLLASRISRFIAKSVRSGERRNVAIAKSASCDQIYGLSLEDFGNLSMMPRRQVLYRYKFVYLNRARA